MLKGIKDVQEGRDPQHVIRDPAANNLAHLFAHSEVVPKETDWKELCNRIAAERDMHSVEDAVVCRS
jgi:hypothetical protein